jgi:FkbH-like protein
MDTEPIEQLPQPAFRLVVAATFTAEPIKDALAFWMEELGFAASIEFAPYDQVFQQLLDPGSLLAQTRKGVNIVLVRIDDWQRSHAGSATREQIAAHMARSALDLIAAVQTALARSSTPLILALCPSSRATLADRESRQLVARIEEQVSAALHGAAGLCLIRPDDFRDVTVDAYDDPQRDELGHIPYTSLFFAELATLLARRIHALVVPPYKVIVLDCDNTLWSGVVGEAGIAGIAIPPAWRHLQQLMVDLSCKGFLLCLCSKNAESDVLDVFEQRPDMILKRDHLVSWRINWQPKSANINSLAQELNLGLDSFIFLDDNPIECAEVRAACPEVLTLRLPIESDMARFLDHVWAFDRVSVTAEDQQRTAMYRQDVERSQFQKQARTIDEFLAGLDLQVRIAEPEPEQRHRVAQLTQRTNQFNFTTIRRNEKEIERLRESGLECRVVEVSDRFGDYGLVGVMIFAARASALEIDSFLLSCRVLGRGVEHRMLSHLGTIARERGLSSVIATLIPTRKNLPAALFLASVAGDSQPEIEGRVCYTIPADRAASLAYVPAAPAVEPETEVSTVENTKVAARPQADATAKSQRFERIAGGLSSAPQVLELLRARSGHRRSRAGLAAPLVAPRTKTEGVLAEIWAELLRLEPVGIDDDYFHLGGTSLQAVDLFAQIDQQFGKRLPLASLIEAPTIDKLAHLVDGPANSESLVLLRDGGDKPALFLIHDGDGETMLYRNLALLLGPEHAAFGLQPLSRENVPIAHTRISDMAAFYIDRIRSVQPHGPYLLGGMCAGGVIAFEVALQMQSQGDHVALVALLDAADVAAPPKTWRLAGQRIQRFSSVFHQQERTRFDRRVLSACTKALKKARNLSTYLVRQRSKELRDAIKLRLFRFYLDRGVRLPRSLEQIPVRTVYLFAEKSYQPQGQYDGELVLLRATRGEGPDEPYVERYLDPLLGWGQRATQGVCAHDVPGGHSSMLQEPNVRTLAEQLQASIDLVLRRKGPHDHQAHRPRCAAGTSSSRSSIPSFQDRQLLG